MSSLIIRAKLERRFGERVATAPAFDKMPTFLVQPEKLVEVCRFLKDDPDLRFNFLSDMCGVDFYPEKNRYEVVYHLYSIPFKMRARLKCGAGDPPKLPTVTGVWRTANWHEREAYDMYGVQFEGHPDLRRIYMWEEFEGFPLRKDFPLRGYKDSHNPFGEEESWAPPTFGRTSERTK